MKPITRTLIVALVSSLLLVSFDADAQQAGKLPRVGFLWGGSPGSPAPFIQAFQQGLHDFGWVDGQNVTVEYRYAEGKAERVPDLAAELVRLPVDVIVAPGPATLAAKTATTTIPIVFALGADPVAFGVMASLTPHGGNITGVTEMTPELTPKRLGLLKELMPTLTRVALLWQPGALREETFSQMLQEAKDTAQSLGLQLQVVEARTANDLDTVFDAMVRERAEGLIVFMSPMFNGQATRIADLAGQHRLPAIYEWWNFVARGGLISYGAALKDICHQTAAYVDRILKGARPADLPVAGPAKFELIINLKAAKTLGLAIPQALLLRADQVIE